MRRTTYSQKELNKNSLNNPQKYIGKVDTIVTRSSWEYSFVQYLDNNDSILEWASEELPIPYLSPIDNQLHRYFPDFYIKYVGKNGDEKEAIIEIKPYHETKEPNGKKMKRSSFMYAMKTWKVNQAKWKAAQSLCMEQKQKRGRVINFFVLTEKDILLVPKEKLDEEYHDMVVNDTLPKEDNIEEECEN